MSRHSLMLALALGTSSTSSFLPFFLRPAENNTCPRYIDRDCLMPTYCECKRAMAARLRTQQRMRTLEKLHLT